jgi:hydrogenase maturation protease
MPARVIALGQRLAGDDAAGLAVADRLRARGLDPIEVASAADLVTALEAPGDVVLVDAVLGEPAGSVLVLAPDDLAGGGLAAVSSHGIDVPSAIALASMLYPGPRSVRVVGVVIGRAPRFTEGLSPEVAAGVEVATDRVIAIAGSL